MFNLEKMYVIIKKSKKGGRYMKINSKKLKYYRKKMGLKSQEFAKLCNIPVGTYFSYEAGSRSPKKERISIIAHILNVSIDDITESNEEYIKEQANKDILKERVEIDTKLLKIKRKQFFKNAYEFANRIGICIAAYYTYERGSVKPTRLMSRKLCNELNLDFDRLVKTR